MSSGAETQPQTDFCELYKHLKDKKLTTCNCFLGTLQILGDFPPEHDWNKHVGETTYVALHSHVHQPPL